MELASGTIAAYLWTYGLRCMLLVSKYHFICCPALDITVEWSKGNFLVLIRRALRDQEASQFIDAVKSHFVEITAKDAYLVMLHQVDSCVSLMSRAPQPRVYD
eukprot:464630-Amphidinium_carterae.1